MTKNRFALIALSFVLLVNMAGCGVLQAPPTSTPVPTPTLVPTATPIVPGIINGVNVYDVLKANNFVYETNKPEFFGMRGFGQLWDDSDTLFNKDTFLIDIFVLDNGEVEFDGGDKPEDISKEIADIQPVIMAVWGKDVLTWVIDHASAMMTTSGQRATVGNFTINMWYAHDEVLDICPLKAIPGCNY